MPGGPVLFSLSDGEVLTLAAAELLPLYELLWHLAPKAGSVSAAAVLRGVMATRPVGSPIDLDHHQSAAMREAVALLHP